jgi:hypothetical protein
MSQPTQEEVRLLGRIADELREVFAERGYRVDVAMETDPAFGSGRSRSSMTRDLVVDAVTFAASRCGVDHRAVNGDGRELRYLAGSIDRRYRLRKARRTTDGSLLITSSAASALAVDEDTLFIEETWTFAWTLTSDGMIDEVLIAEVVGYVEGNPGYLKLGRVIPLGGSGEPSGGFRPADEDLDIFEDGRDESGEFGLGSS